MAHQLTHEELLAELGVHALPFPEDVVPARYREFRYETLDPDAQRLAHSLLDGRDWSKGLLLYGPPGTGKTTIAAIAMRHAYKANVSRRPRWMSVSRALDDVRRSFNSDDPTPPLHHGADFIVLDDLGRERGTDWTRETLYILASEIYDSCTPLVVTTNLMTEEQVKRHVGEQVVSRWVESLDWVKVDGDDRRRS